MPAVPSMNPSYPRPDFALLGVGDGFGGVLLLASAYLSEASLSQSIPGYLIGAGMRIPDYAYEMSCVMRQVTIIRAENYADAFRSLMNVWRPPDPPRESGPRALGQ